MFDKNLYLESLTVGAHYSMGEILEKAGMNTLLGMGTVFVVLIFTLLPADSLFLATHVY